MMKYDLTVLQHEGKYLIWDGKIDGKLARANGQRDLDIHPDHSKQL